MVPMAPSQRSAENFNKKLAAKAKRGIVASGASGMGKTVNPKDLKPKELPCPHCDRLFKQQDRLKQHVAKHHVKEMEAIASEEKPTQGSGDASGREEASEAVSKPLGTKPSSSCSEGNPARNRGSDVSWEWNGQPQATVFRNTAKDPKTVLQEYTSKKKDVKKPRYVLDELPEGKGWTCKVVLPDKYKPEKDVVLFSNAPSASKEEAQQLAAVAALARVAHNLPLQRLLPARYARVFLECEAEEREKATKARLEQEERERRLKKPKERERQELRMSEEKRNLVEDLLRAAAASGTSLLESKTVRGTGENDATGEEILRATTRTLLGLGFGERDVEAALGAKRDRDVNLTAALDWLCLNVPEARLPKKYAPRAGNESIVLVDARAAFAPAGSIRRAEETRDSFLANGHDAPRPTDRVGAFLYDRGFEVWEIERAAAAAAASGFDETAALEHAFRSVLQSAAPREDAWAFWPSRDGPDVPGVRSSLADPSPEENDAWEDEMIAVEAIFGEDHFSRVSPRRARVSIQSGIGNAVLEIYRPSGNAYPATEPPVVSLVSAERGESDAAGVPRGALRAATSALAAQAAAAAEDGATCVFELASAAAAFLEEHRDAPLPSRLAACDGPSVLSANDETVSSEAVASGSPSRRLKNASRREDDVFSSGKKPTETSGKERRDDRPLRVVSRAFMEKESVRLKLAQERYFGSTRGFVQEGSSGPGRNDSAAAFTVSSRSALPAAASREEVADAVSKFPVVVLSGETGCGKSTQVPQFLLERAIMEDAGGFTNIVCTQPRRISAIGLAERVAAERLETCGDVVGYSVRLEKKVSERTRIHFCTMGILLRRLLGDPLLRGITHVILDEVHERSVESDLLLLLLRRLMSGERKRDLRVVLMSATADADFFAKYFTEPDAASVSSGVTAIAARKVFIKGFTHPVREYFLEDVLEMTGFVVGKNSAWAKKKSAQGAASGSVADANGSVADGAFLGSASTKEADAAPLAGANSPAKEIVPEDWEDDDGFRAPLNPKPAAARVSNREGAEKEWDADEKGSETRDEKTVSKKRSAEIASAERERARRDALAEASRRLSEYGEATQRSIANIDESLLNYELIETLIGAIARVEKREGERALVAPPESAPAKEVGAASSSSGAILIFLPGQMEITRLIRKCEQSRLLEEADVGKLQFLPLYGALSSNDQRKIFARAPPGVRKIVVATNIAETSVTIDDVRYVIDTGRSKEMGYDSTRGLSVLADAWISRAASMQRRGRAGRTAPGACFALFSRKTRANLTPHQPPEMLRTPLQQLCLNIKALAPAGSLLETLASAPTPPAVESIQSALSELCALRALDAKTETLTPLGRHVARMPVDVRIGKMLVFGALLGCLDPILTIAASMSGRPMFVSPKDSKAEADSAKKKLSVSGKSDHLTMANAYKEWYRSGNGVASRGRFCDRHFLSRQAMESIQASRNDYAAVLADLGFVTRQYLQNLRREGFGGGVADRNANASRVVKAALVAGFYPQVVNVRHPETKFAQTAGGTVEKESQDGKLLKFYCKDLGRVFLHPSSVNAHVGKFESPWLVFSERVETARIFIRDNTMVGAYALLLFGGDIEVDHEKGRVLMAEGWAQFSAPARIGVLIREMRRAVDALLERHIDAPVEEGEEASLSESPVVKAVVELLATEGA